MIVHRKVKVIKNNDNHHQCHFIQGKYNHMVSEVKCKQTQTSILFFRNNKSSHCTSSSRGNQICSYHSKHGKRRKAIGTDHHDAEETSRPHTRVPSWRLPVFGGRWIRIPGQIH